MNSFKVAVTDAHVFSDAEVDVGFSVVTLDGDVVPVVLVVSEEVPLVDAATFGVGITAYKVCVGLLAAGIGPEMFPGGVEEEEEITTDAEGGAGETVLEP